MALLPTLETRLTFGHGVYTTPIGKYERPRNTGQSKCVIVASAILGETFVTTGPIEKDARPPMIRNTGFERCSFLLALFAA